MNRVTGSKKNPSQSVFSFWTFRKLTHCLTWSLGVNCGFHLSMVHHWSLTEWTQLTLSDFFIMKGTVTSKAKIIYAWQRILSRMLIYFYAWIWYLYKINDPRLKIHVNWELWTCSSLIRSFFCLKSPWCSCFSPPVVEKSENLFNNICHFLGILGMKFSLLMLYC